MQFWGFGRPLVVLPCLPVLYQTGLVHMRGQVGMWLPYLDYLQDPAQMTQLSCLSSGVSGLPESVVSTIIT